ncbi:uncharacterized protein LOC124889277 [Capsicum annuum]|uniref:uncharacterized protein LOC124889277 n=1 Tax=Capsicum annuum TaxID=4072 RepID=UPI001FB0E633|nr:uncharacterized protein LOC124889277 [Capsicum annuum]
MENSNLEEGNIRVEVPSEETNMDETGQIVPYIDVENLQHPTSSEDCVSNDQVGEKDCEMNQIENYKNYIQASALAASSTVAKISSGWIGCLFLQFSGKSNNHVHSSNDHSRYNFSGKSNKC